MIIQRNVENKVTKILKFIFKMIEFNIQIEIDDVSFKYFFTSNLYYANNLNPERTFIDLDEGTLL